MVVDLKKGDVYGAIAIPDVVVGVCVAEEALPEIQGFGEIGDEERDVRDAEDLRTSDGGLREKRLGKECAEKNHHT